MGQRQLQEQQKQQQVDQEALLAAAAAATAPDTFKKGDALAGGRCGEGWAGSAHHAQNCSMCFIAVSLKTLQCVAGQLLQPHEPSLASVSCFACAGQGTDTGGILRFEPLEQTLPAQSCVMTYTQGQVSRFVPLEQTFDLDCLQLFLEPGVCCGVAARIHQCNLTLSPISKCSSAAERSTFGVSGARRSIHRSRGWAAARRGCLKATTVNTRPTDS
ncbi:hypothetical protein COO60DRAFT_179427 [Scenedesmus sp. NREL 46B-D3]|nr:hypothetical protein COO60DRAFT_179427 [Scenedesmus sp. NREL 46B-D3]